MNGPRPCGRNPTSGVSNEAMVRQIEPRMVADDAVKLSTETSSVTKPVAGDVGAVSDLYDRYGSRVYRQAIRIVRDPEDAKDVVQEVFVQAWRQAASFDPRRGSACAWLIPIARSRAIDRVRRRRVSMFHIRAESIDAVDTQSGAISPSQEGIAVRREQSRQIVLALRLLPVDQHRAIALAYLEGLTHCEIAIQLQQPLGTIKTRIRMALITLRVIFQSPTSTSKPTPPATRCAPPLPQLQTSPRTPLSSSIRRQSHATSGVVALQPYC